MRLAYVSELPLSDREAIAAMAREDEDARVRRAAVAKLMAPKELAAIARDDRDESVRAQAMAMLRDIALEAFEDLGEMESLEAVEEIVDARALAGVAKSSGRDSVATRALSRVTDTHLLGSIARHAATEAARLGAFDTLRARGERAELLAVAMNGDFKDTAVAAVDLFADRAELDQVVARGRNKNAVKRARAILREGEEAAARAAAVAAAERTALLIAEHPAVLEPQEDAATPPHGDPIAESAAPEEALVPIAAPPAEDADAVAAREADAARVAADAQAEAARESERRHARLAELVDAAVAAAADEQLATARPAFTAVAREWHALATGSDVDAALAARFAEFEQAFHARDEEARAADAKARREAQLRIQQLLARVEPMPAKADLTLKAAERALRDVRTTLSSMPALPTRQDGDEAVKRLKAAQTALMPRVQELRDADDWRRFANLGVQEQLCAKMEALRQLESPDAIAREVRVLQQQWREAADVPRAQADALWRRFKAAHDEVWTRCETHFAAQAEERGANLARKLALCEQAEALADSTNWIQTAEAIKKLQADWKAIGPVSRGREKAIWDRFRAACDRFFTRRHDDLAQRKTVWADNLAKKDALCARAEALAESTDWDTAAAEVRKLQAEWKTVGPVKKSKSEAIWQRFRGACDRFFARYAGRHETARAERVAAREAICAELEALSAADTMPAEVAAATRTLRSRWQQEIAARGVDPDRARALDQRFGAAVTAVVSKWPQAFAGSDLDPEANRKRMEMLVRRMEDLAQTLAGPAPADDSLSPTNRLAAMLKEALAANTIGGKVDEDVRLRAALEEVRQAQSLWTRVGLVADDAKRSLGDRFQRAVRTINERASKAGVAAFSGAAPARSRENNRRGSSPAS